MLKQAELTQDEFRLVHQHCAKRHLRFMCTPWDEESLRFLEGLGVEVYKVASADLINLPLLERLCATGKPLILSTGMASLAEIRTTVEYLQAKGAKFALLHCVSTYPAPFESLNLRFLTTLKQFGVPVGYSGHERGIAVPVAALALGARIIEKHLTLDRSLPGPDHAASLEPQGFEKLVRDLRNAEVALGSPQKSLTTMELLNRQVLGKSLVAARDLPAGTTVTREMVKVCGPGKGLSPQRLEGLIGVQLTRALRQGEYFVEHDLDPSPPAEIQRERLRRPWGLKARFHDLAEVLARKPRVVELHFSAEDVDYHFAPPAQKHPQQLFVHAPEFAGSRLLDLCSPDDEVRERACTLLQRTINKAVELGRCFSGPVGVVIHVGGMSMDEPIRDRDRLLTRAVEAFRRLESHGAVLLPENLPPRPWYLGGQWIQNVFIRPEEMIEICQELGLGMTLDISHAQLSCNVTGQKLIDFVKLCLPYTRHLHLADAQGIDGEGLQIGEGVVEWDTVLELLARSDFTWVPEIWSGHLREGAGFVEALNRLSRYDVL
jgi:N-acetylneuraminate synthase